MSAAPHHPDSQRPFRLGVTGGIASGKSTVMALLRDRCAETIDADLVYRDLIQPGRPLHARLVERWGEKIVAADGTIDRRALGAIVFSDPEQLADLDRLTHPAIRERIDELFEAATARVVAIDAVKLIESGHADRCDAVWLVVADPRVQVDRLVKDRGLERDDAERRVVAQPELAPRIARADRVIMNDGNLNDLAAAVDAAWRDLPL